MRRKGDQREEKEEKERLMKAKKRMMMRVMPRTRKGDIQVLISLQLNLDEGQRRTKEASHSHKASIYSDERCHFSQQVVCP